MFIYEIDQLLTSFFYSIRMHSVMAIIIAIILIVLFYFMSIYNQLVFLKNNIQKNFSNIGVLLKQRNNQLEKLVDSCIRYMDYEKDTLTKITKIRNELVTACDNRDINTINAKEGELRSSLKQLFALAENYPNLKSDNLFNNLQKSIVELENNIADRRELYNDSVNSNNIAIEQFPNNIIAAIAHFNKHELLIFAAKEIEDVSIKNLFEKNNSK